VGWIHPAVGTGQWQALVTMVKRTFGFHKIREIYRLVEEYLCWQSWVTRSVQQLVTYETFKTSGIYSARCVGICSSPAKCEKASDAFAVRGWRILTLSPHSTFSHLCQKAEIWTGIQSKASYVLKLVTQNSWINNAVVYLPQTPSAGGTTGTNWTAINVILLRQGTHDLSNSGLLEAISLLLAPVKDVINPF
jgi:hypothetical protein